MGDRKGSIKITYINKGTTVGKAPTQDNLLVFYIENADQWKQACLKASSAGFKEVKSYNPYWDVVGSTYEDIDGYRIVFQYEVWS